MELLQLSRLWVLVGVVILSSWGVSCAKNSQLEAKVLNVPEELQAAEVSLKGLEVNQAVPFARGAWLAEDGNLYSVQTDNLQGMAKVVTRWPDHSAQWVHVNGILNENSTQGIHEIPLHLQPFSKLEVVENPVWGGEFVWQENRLVLQQDNKSLLMLRPTASMVAVQKPKAAIEEKPDVWEQEGQYLWAAPLESLQEQTPVLLPLTMVMKSSETVEQNAYRSVYLVRGVGEFADSGDKALEWQLRLERVWGSPGIKMEMTWRAFWNEQRWALAGASWEVKGEQEWSVVESSAGRVELGQDKEVYAAHMPQGHSVSSEATESVADQPAEWWVLSGKSQASWGLGFPRLAKLGPNRIQVSQSQVTIHCWDLYSGLALDLRQTGKQEDFGRDRTDAESRPYGLSRTIECVLFAGTEKQSVRALAQHVSQRDEQWLPTASQILQSQVLGPIHPQIVERHSEYLQGVLANAHFLKASQDRWKWYGFINYGDIRTNFSKWSNEERGLYPKRWAWYGRYGWRNGAGDVPHGMLYTGLLLNDREITLMALDYARHISDVDISHASWFHEPHSEAGGMHRRNRDHWSGSVQMQYSPTNGLYLASWLTGDAVIEAALEGVRYYALSRGEHSAFAAQAWINRYAETQDERDLDRAWKLLYECAYGWSMRSPSKLTGLEALYDHNFRWYSDGVSTLERFYETTDSQEILLLIRNIVIREINTGVKSHPSLGYESAMGYLLGAGMSIEQIGPEYLLGGKEYLQKLHPKPLPDRSQWDYETLVHIATELLVGEGGDYAGYLESASIGARMRRAFFAMLLLEAVVGKE